MLKITQESRKLAHWVHPIGIYQGVPSVRKTQFDLNLMSFKLILASEGPQAAHLGSAGMTEKFENTQL